MGDFNHIHIQWKYIDSGEDQKSLFLIEDGFLTQNMLDPTREENVSVT